MNANVCFGEIVRFSCWVARFFSHGYNSLEITATNYNKSVPNFLL